jgi:hypothetical protein
MGSKIKVIDIDDKRYGCFGYVCEWKHDNESCMTAVKVQMMDDEIVWFADSQIEEIL